MVRGIAVLPVKNLVTLNSFLTYCRVTGPSSQIHGVGGYDGA